MNTQELIAEMEREIGRFSRKLTEKLVWLETNKQKLDELGLEVTTGWQSIDFDNLPHKDIVRVMLAFPGKWEKQLNQTTIDYILRISPTLSIRCYMGEPPPSCKLVEEVVVVPEQVIPTHTTTKTRLVCTNNEANNERE